MTLRILLLPAVGLLLLAVKPGFFQPRDFVEYWSAARVLADGGDPYDAAQLLPVQRVATGNPELAEVVSLWTPPWTLPIYRPFGFEPFAVARHLWIALQLLLIAVSVELLWRVYSGGTGLRAGVLPVAGVESPPTRLANCVRRADLPHQGGGGGFPFIRQGRTDQPANTSPLVGEVAPSATHEERVGGTVADQRDLGSLLPHLLALAFAPVFWTLFYGQNTGILLLGLSGFLYFRTHDRPGLAGAFAALTALKPHLLAAFGVVLVLDALTRPGRKALLAGIAVIAAGAMAAVLLNPDIFQQFLASMQRPRTPEAIALSDWQVPLLAYHLRMVVAPAAFWVQFVPCLLLALASVPYYCIRRKGWDWRTELPRLVLASALLAPYGAWIFDLTVLLVPVIAAGALVAKKYPARPASGSGRPLAGRAGYFFGLPFALLFFGGIQPLMLQQFIWFTPAVVLLAGTTWFLTADRIPEPVGENRVSGAAPRAVSL